MTSLTTRFDANEKNLIINGAMDFWQRGTSFTGISAPAVQYTADRMRINMTSSAAVYRFDQDTDVPTFAQSRFNGRYSLKLTPTTPEASPPTGTFIGLTYRFEGQDIQEFLGKTVRVQFWVKSHLAGTYSLGVRSSDSTRSWVTTYTIFSPDTWEKKAIDIPLEAPSAAYPIDNTMGLQLNFPVAVGATFATSTLNTWLGGNFLGASAQVNLSASTSNIFKITQIQLVPQDLTQASSSGVDIPFQRAGRTIQQELAMCQRYCYSPFLNATANSGHYVGVGPAFAATIGRIFVPFPVTMRTGSPTLTVINPTTDFIMLASNGGSIAVTTMSIDRTGPTGLSLDVGCASGLVAGNATVLRSASATIPTMYFETEL